jgi:hypothetical protein
VIDILYGLFFSFLLWLTLDGLRLLSSLLEKEEQDESIGEPVSIKKVWYDEFGGKYEIDIPYCPPPEVDSNNADELHEDIVKNLEQFKAIEMQEKRYINSDKPGLSEEVIKRLQRKERYNKSLHISSTIRHEMRQKYDKQIHAANL